MIRGTALAIAPQRHEPAPPRPRASSFAKHLVGANAQPADDPGAAPAQPAAQAPVAVPDALSALVQLVTETVQRAIAAVRPATAPASAQAAARPEVTPAEFAACMASTEPPHTPLEQAVHDLLAHLDRDEPSEPREMAAPAPQPALAHVTITATHEEPPAIDPAAHAAPAAPVEPPAELPAPTSHVHLVVDDGAARVVVTIAVRGEEVRVAMRTNDDSLAAGLARNAGSLDHAMRVRGLDLKEMTAERDPNAPKRDREPAAREPKTSQERFALEENR